MSLIKNLIPENQYPTKCPYSMQPKGICIHNTANDAPAINERNYMARGDNQNEVSFHIAIDDKEAIQCIPFNRNAWHAGDGGSGQGNRNYIAVEICYSKSGGDRFIKAEKRAAKEVAALLKQYGWTSNNVKKHQDFSNKDCPHRTLDMGWQRFLNMIQAELNGESIGITKDEVSIPQPPQNSKKYLHLKSHVSSWRVYPINVAPVVGNECGTLSPKKYGGLKYEILGNPQTDVYTIQTESFGRVNIYAPRDNDSTITDKPTYNNGNPISSSTPVSNKKYLNLHPHMSKWNVYPLNVAPVTGNQCGALAPAYYGGLSYEILEDKGDVKIINTATFGKVQIYAPRDNDSSVTENPIY